MKRVVATSLLFFLISPASGQTEFWQQTNGPNSGAIYSLAVDSAGFVFAGCDNGLYRSSDYGRTWRKQALNASYVLGFAVNDSDIIYAATLNGVHFSRDHGNTWSSINDGLTNLSVNCIAVDSSNNLVVGTRGGGVFFLQHGTAAWVAKNVGLPNHYITCVAFNMNGIAIVGTDSSGLFRSTDGGLIWSPSTTGLTNRWTNVLTSTPYGAFFVATQAGVYRSVDEGITWVQTNNGLTNTLVWGLHTCLTGQIFAGTLGGGAFRSTDNGNQWSRISDVSMGRAFAVTEPAHILYGTDYDGLLGSTDNGSTWALVGLPRARVNAMLAHQSGWLFAHDNEQSHGVSRSSNRGHSWNKYPYFIVSCFATNLRGEIYAGMGQGISRSTDNGDTWSLLSNQIVGGVASLLVDSTDVMYAGANMITLGDGGGLYRSTDRGFNWTRTAFAGPTVRPLAMNSSGHIIAGVSGALHRSTNGGISWQQMFGPTYVTSLAIKSDGSLYAGSGAYGVFFSSNNGNTWSQAGLSGSNIQCLFVSPDDAVYCGTQNDGVFVRRESDTSFTPLSSGLTSQGVLSLAMDESGYLYAGSYDGGVFRSTSSITSIREPESNIPVAFTLRQNYPNPFNPSTTIRYELSRSSFVTLSVYNILGQQVTQLVNEKQSVGYHQVIFQSDALASGVYIFQLQADEYIEARKMLLLR